MKASRPSFPIAVVGCDYRVAPSRLRSRLVLDCPGRQKLLGELKDLGAADAFVELATCNRNEWVVSSDRPDWAAQLLVAKMKATAKALGPKLCPYVYAEREALEHLLYVSAGAKSLVTGERQIAGQLFSALELARTEGTSNRILNGLGTAAGRMLRLADESGCRCRTGRGVHSLAVGVLRERFAQKKGKTKVAVVGLGSVGAKVLGLIERDPLFTAVPCNRTVSADAEGRVHPLDRLDELLREVEAAVFCTGAQSPIAGPETFASIDKSREFTVVDIGIPEQVTREGLPPNVSLIGIDDLTDDSSGCEIEDTSLKPPLDKAVAAAIDDFALFCQVGNFKDILGTVRKGSLDIIYDKLPGILEKHLSQTTSSTARKALEQELRHLVRQYESTLLTTVKATTKTNTDKAT